MTLEEQKNNLVEVLGNTVAEHLEKNSPVTDDFSSLRVRFPVIGTENKGIMTISYKAPGEVRLQPSVWRGRFLGLRKNRRKLP